MFVWTHGEGFYITLWIIVAWQPSQSWNNTTNFIQFSARVDKLGPRWSDVFSILHSTMTGDLESLIVEKNRETICCLRLANSVKSYQDSSIHQVGVQIQDWQIPDRASFLRTPWRSRKATPAGLRIRDPCQRPFIEARGRPGMLFNSGGMPLTYSCRRSGIPQKIIMWGPNCGELKNLDKPTRLWLKFWS